MNDSDSLSLSLRPKKINRSETSDNNTNSNDINNLRPGKRGVAAGRGLGPSEPRAPYLDAAFCLAFRRRCLGVRSILSTGDRVSPRRWDRTCSRNSATQVSICAMLSAILASRAFFALARLACFLKKTSFSGFRSLSNGHSLPARRQPATPRWGGRMGPWSSARPAAPGVRRRAAPRGGGGEAGAGRQRPLSTPPPPGET